MSAVKIEIDKSKLKALTEKQVVKQGKFAMAMTLTNLAFDVREETQHKLPQWLHITKSFIPRSVVVNKAKVTNLTSQVGFLKRVKMIGLMEDGGTRRPTRRKVAVPYKYVKRNAKGGITKANRPRQLLAKKNVFSKNIGGVAGIWKRVGKRLQLLWGYEPQTKYQGRTTHFRDTAMRVARANLQKKFNKNLHKAIATMRK